MERGFRQMKLKAPIYSAAKSQSIKQFFSRLEKYFEHQRVEENDRVEALGLVLESIALEAYDSLRRNEENIEYENLKTALIERFDESDQKLVIRNKLANYSVHQSIQK